MGKKLVNARLGAPATAATASRTLASTAAAAEASSVEWNVHTLAGNSVAAFTYSRTIRECVENLYTDVARIVMRGLHDREHFMLVYEGEVMETMSDENLRSINNPIFMIKRVPPPWWFMRGTNTCAEVFRKYRMPTRMVWAEHHEGRELGWPGSLNIDSTCERWLPQPFDEVVGLSASQIVGIIFRACSGYIERARLILLHSILSQNGILNGLQLDLYDIHRILIALTSNDSRRFLLMVNTAVDIANQTAYTGAADRSSDPELSAQISTWLADFTTRETLV
jgi:hypothetical protein